MRDITSHGVRWQSAGHLKNMFVECGLNNNKNMFVECGLNNNKNVFVECGLNNKKNVFVECAPAGQLGKASRNRSADRID